MDYVEVPTPGFKKSHVRQKLCLVTEFIFMPLIWISGVIDAVRKFCIVSRNAYSCVNVASIISHDPASHTPRRRGAGGSDLGFVGGVS